MTRRPVNSSGGAISGGPSFVEATSYDVAGDATRGDDNDVVAKQCNPCLLARLSYRSPTTDSFGDRLAYESAYKVYDDFSFEAVMSPVVEVLLPTSKGQPRHDKYGGGIADPRLVSGSSMIRLGGFLFRTEVAILWLFLKRAIIELMNFPPVPERS